MTPDAADDVGLLSPGSVGSAAARLTGDLAYLQAMLDAEVALARAQATVGVIPAEAAKEIGACADAAGYDVRGLAARAVAGANPVIPLVEDLRAAVWARDADAARWVHHGATSQDILDTATMLVAVRVLDVLSADLARAAGATARLAAEHRDTPMAARTLARQAVPTTFGARAATWLGGLLDAADRVATVRASLPAQLGGAAGTLAALGESGPAVLAAFAAETGLVEPPAPWHALRTPVADLAGALALTAGALGKAALDVTLLASTEIGEVAEATGGTSSAMPHKQNPARAVLVVASARQVPGLASTLYASMLGEHERAAGAWHAEWAVLRSALRLVGGGAELAADLLGGLRVDAEAMRANLDRGDIPADLVVAPGHLGAAGVFVDRVLARAQTRDGSF